MTTDAETVEKIRDYANGLRIWGVEATRDIANDILHIIEGDK